MRKDNEDDDTFDFDSLDIKADRFFGDFVAHDKPRRLQDVLREASDSVSYRSAEWLATQPIRIRKPHPFLGQAARCGEILTGCDASTVLQVHIDPGKEGKWKRGEVPFVHVMVCTSDGRWHEANNVTIERLIGAWIDARQLDVRQ